MKDQTTSVTATANTSAVNVKPGSGVNLAEGENNNLPAPAPTPAKKTRARAPRASKRDVASLIIPAAPNAPQEFFSLQSREFRELYTAFMALPPDIASDTSASTQAIAELLTSSSFKFSPSTAQEIAARLAAAFSSLPNLPLLDPPPPHEDSPSSNPPPKPKITVSLEDYQRFLEVASADPTPPQGARELLLSFIIFYRRNYHPSGWVRYDKKNIFYLAGISALPTRRQEKLTAYLHTHCNLNMQVVGSNQPIPCYNIPWIQSQPTPPTPSNPMITLGDLAPQTVCDLVSKSFLISTTPATTDP